MIAALFVDPRGPYASRPDVDAWDEARDARLYDGVLPVIGHPPCSRWCQLAGLVQARWGHRKGDDGGCFASALASVRRCGGVLEHPAYSKAWPAFGLPRPPTQGGWVRGLCGGWACHVEQGWYGHPARKATWLYAFGTALPLLRWGTKRGAAVMSQCGNKTDPSDKRKRIIGPAAIRTPPEFVEILVSMAKSVT